MISKISFTNSYADHERRMAEFCRATLQRQELNQKGKENYKALKKELDNKVFTFKAKDGKAFKGTIKEFLENSISNRRKIYAGDKTMYHATTSRDVAMNIIQNGLDWTKTHRMKCGPGTYFAPCAEEARMQVGNSIIIEGVYKGDKDTYPILRHGFYDSITDNDEVMRIVRKFHGNEGGISKYCHDLMQNDMGIDFFYSSPGYGGAYVVLNDDCLSLSTYEW